MEPMDVGLKAFYCEACEVQCASEDHFNNHSRTVMHTQYVLLHEKKQKEATQTYEQEVADFRVQEDDKGNVSYYCEVCRTRMSGEEPYQAHLLGDRHLKNMERKAAGVAPVKRKASTYQKLLKEAEDDPAKIAEIQEMYKPGNLRCKKLIKEAQEPLIGLQFVIEYQNEDPNIEQYYWCNMCNMKADPRTLLSHITALKHRLTCFKERYMHYHVTIRQGNYPKAVQTDMAYEFAEEIENEEGRQDIVVEVIKNPLYDPNSIKELKDIPADGMKYKFLENRPIKKKEKPQPKKKKVPTATLR